MTIKYESILKPEQIPFNHWGIINKYNFDGDFKKLPIKRWDPLFSVQFFSKNNSIPYKNVGNYSYISTIRKDRPHEFRSKIYNFEKCIDVFKPIIDGRNYYDEDGHLISDGYAIVLTDGTKKVDDVFSSTPRLRKIENKVCTIINRYPAMARIIDEEIIQKVNKSNFLDEYSKIAVGINLVSLVSDFYDEIVDIPINIFAELIESMSVAIKLSVNSAIERNIKFIPVSPFINHGKMVGGSLDRIHAQVYIDLNEDGFGHRIEILLESFAKKNKDKCFLCNFDPKDRLIYENSNWILFAAGSPIRNYHLRFVPKEHYSSLTDITKKEVFIDLADIVIKSFKALDRLHINRSRNIIFNIKPYGYMELNYHLFGDIIPFEFIGGAEMSDSMRVCKISPIEFAKTMRNIIKEKDYFEI